jgi:hypothetical protein
MEITKAMQALMCKPTHSSLKGRAASTRETAAALTPGHRVNWRTLLTISREREGPLKRKAASPHTLCLTLTSKTLTNNRLQDHRMWCTRNPSHNPFCSRSRSPASTRSLRFRSHSSKAFRGQLTSSSICSPTILTKLRRKQGSKQLACPLRTPPTRGLTILNRTTCFISGEREIPRAGIWSTSTCSNIIVWASKGISVIPANSERWSKIQLRSNNQINNTFKLRNSLFNKKNIIGVNKILTSIKWIPQTMASWGWECLNHRTMPCKPSNWQWMSSRILKAYHNHNLEFKIKLNRLEILDRTLVT